jgi:hypothetical protein
MNMAWIWKWNKMFLASMGSPFGPRSFKQKHQVNANWFDDKCIIDHTLGIGTYTIKCMPTKWVHLVLDKDGAGALNVLYSNASAIRMLQYLHAHSHPDTSCMCNEPLFSLCTLYKVVPWNCFGSTFGCIWRVWFSKEWSYNQMAFWISIVIAHGHWICQTFDFWR